MIHVCNLNELYWVRLKSQACMIRYDDALNEQFLKATDNTAPSWLNKRATLLKANRWVKYVLHQHLQPNESLLFKCMCYPKTAYNSHDETIISADYSVACCGKSILVIIQTCWLHVSPTWDVPYVLTLRADACSYATFKWYKALLIHYRQRCK